MPKFKERSSETSLDKWEISDGKLPATEDSVRLRCVMFAKPPNLDEIAEPPKWL